MRNIKLIIEYDGTNYCGWQTQKNGPSIQAEIEKSLEKLTGEAVRIHGSGRTDAGVHARGQVANFMTDSTIPGDKFSYALNNLLPRDIVIKDSTEVSPDFHARFCAVGKKYSYLVLNSRFPTALLRNYAYHINYCERLDIEKIKKAAEAFIGTHDFSGFMAAGSKITDAVRTIYDISVENEKNLICISYKANGFLYNMVRIITGTLLYTGIDKICPEDIKDIILSKDRERAGITAPACGLYLEEVYYDFP
ncbi:MAG TPA: tRNA pseudouridine(38-40) synthase TruA [Bacillota bacterium]|nr:tRNA pseudouridine(38-40) synthase TruA [Bacillota bacterium]HOR86391.1 tRNA pseudouridine(38-40) synthase TruA [Bacillota bacterium]HPL53683.1 tRNA pseudouridine(38-40) synthase TruA [Bacillota bacterium]